VRDRSWWDWERCAYIRGRLERSSDDRPAIQQKYAATAKRIVSQYIVPTFGSMSLDEIRPKTIETWILALRDEEHLSRKSVNNILAVFRVMMGEAHREELVPINPFDKVRPFQADTRERGILTVAEARDVLQLRRWKNQVHYAVNLVAAATAMRQGEILAITTDTLQDDYLDVRHNYDPKYGLGPVKNKRPRLVPLPAPVRAAIDDFCMWKGFVFSSTLGKVPVSGRHVTESLYEVVDGFDEKRDGYTIDRLGRNITFHSWRNFWITYLRNAGVPDREVQAVGGHQTHEMLEHYSRFRPEDFRAVADAQAQLLTEEDKDGIPE
jgi:integrase